MPRKNKIRFRKKNGYSNKDSTNLEKRIMLINDACVKKNISALRDLATTGPGLVNDGLRRLCWPLLLHCEPYDKKNFQEEHRDERQVLLDVNRSFVHYPKGLNYAQRKRKQSELNYIIVEILRRHPKLSYYQGFHDICSVLLLVLGNKEVAIKAGENIAMFLLRDAMLDSLDPVLRQLNLLYILIRREDPEIANFLEESNTLPDFCLSWVITWCSHDVRDLSKVIRLFDFFIASDPLMAIYLSARVVISRRKELLALEDDSAMIHMVLSKFPQYIDIDELISKTIQLYKNYPPDLLQKATEEALDETSCVNLYKHWLELRVDEPINYSDANEILSLPSSARKPVQFKNLKSNKLDKKQSTTLIVLSAAAVLIISNLLIRIPSEF